jgi:putative transcriptional regulator
MTTLGKGILLVASPALRDPNFRQTVVLLCEHGSEGALGVVVNRPTAMSISEALPHVPILEGQQYVLFAGGPVQTNQVLILYRLAQEPSETHHVFDGVYLGGDLAMLERILTSPAGSEAFKAFAGYSGWGPGQLELEMKMGSWMTVPADPAIVFQQDPFRMWPDILRSMGKPYDLYAEMPPDPTLN